MKLSAKQITFVGAFIVLTVAGYIMLPKDQILINLNSQDEYFKSENNNLNSGNNENLIYVHIEGAVKDPGIKVIEKGTRLFELIELANGPLDDADMTKLNLASILKDEQKINIPFKTNTKISENSTEINDKSTNTHIINYVSDEYILININTATSDELQKLEGIGPSMAKKIIEYRENISYFNAIEDIKNVSGIGEAKYNKIKDNITI